MSFARRPWSLQAKKSETELPLEKLANGAVGVDFYKYSQPPPFLADSAVLKMVEEQERSKKGKEVIWPPPRSPDPEYYQTEGPKEAFPIDNEFENVTESNGAALNMGGPDSNFRKIAPANVNHHHHHLHAEFQPPPTFITLRSQAPISQEPVAIIVSQPHYGERRINVEEKWPPTKQHRQQQQIRQHVQHQQQYQGDTQQYQHQQQDQPQQRQEQQQQSQQNQHFLRDQHQLVNLDEQPQRTQRENQQIRQQQRQRERQHHQQCQNQRSLEQRIDSEENDNDDGFEPHRPQSVKDNKARLALAKGPVFRPKRVDKDFSPFLARNASPTFSSYKPPPGTQHHKEEPITEF